eukprot:2037247-Rhodomonas_salina.1
MKSGVTNPRNCGTRCAFGGTPPEDFFSGAQRTSRWLSKPILHSGASEVPPAGTRTSGGRPPRTRSCLLYTSDAADDM